MFEWLFTWAEPSPAVHAQVRVDGLPVAAGQADDLDAFFVLRVAFLAEGLFELLRFSLGESGMDHFLSFLAFFPPSLYAPDNLSGSVYEIAARQNSPGSLDVATIDFGADKQTAERYGLPARRKGARMRVPTFVGCLVVILAVGCLSLGGRHGAPRESQEAPKIEGQDATGRPLTLLDQRGKVVLLSFWHGG
jgi:hypothetical protein